MIHSILIGEQFDSDNLKYFMSAKYTNDHKGALRTKKGVFGNMAVANLQLKIVCILPFIFISISERISDCKIRRDLTEGEILKIME
jgi:hypothetical protein